MQKALPTLLALAVIGLAAAGATAVETYVYTVESGDSLQRIASRQRSTAGYYAADELMRDIMDRNGITGSLIRPGQELEIPVKPPRPHPTVAERVADGAPVRGIYLTGPLCSTEWVFDRVDRFIEAGGNAVVFDAKDADGGVSYRSRQELASWGKGRNAPVISNLDELLAGFRARDLHVTARVACFLDGDLGRTHPELALHDEAGRPWAERDQIWVDPTKSDVRDYVIGLAAEMAASGVDEVQFDYVRFPTNGWKGDHVDPDGGAVDRHDVAARRREVITSFLEQADEALDAYPVEISADLYGIMAWGRLADRAVTGQHIGEIARHVDVICPMVYPSHYKRGYMGYDRPADHPTFFVGEPTKRFLRQAAGRARVRPWLQAFPYRVRNYDADYVAVQIDAAMENGADGWLLWNPASRYGKALAAVDRRKVEPAFVAMVREAVFGETEEVVRSIE